jgi:hypothetical protein
MGLPDKTKGGFPEKSSIFLGAEGDGVNAPEKRNMLICVTNLSELAHLFFYPLG